MIACVTGHTFVIGRSIVLVVVASDADTGVDIMGALRLSWMAATFGKSLCFLHALSMALVFLALLITTSNLSKSVSHASLERSRGCLVCRAARVLKVLVSDGVHQ